MDGSTHFIPKVYPMQNILQREHQKQIMQSAQLYTGTMKQNGKIQESTNRLHWTIPKAGDNFQRSQQTMTVIQKLESNRPWHLITKLSRFDENVTINKSSIPIKFLWIWEAYMAYIYMYWMNPQWNLFQTKPWDGYFSFPSHISLDQLKRLVIM